MAPHLVYSPLKSGNTDGMNENTDAMAASAAADNWSVYLILCGNGALYCGISNNVAKRWRTHCAGKGAKYTRMHKPVAIKVLQAALSASAARQLEYRTKQLGAQHKQTLWQNLSEWCGEGVL